MDEATLNQVRTLIKEAEDRVPGLEKDIARAKEAGLQDIVQVAEQTLADTKTKLAQLKKAYGK